MASAIASAATSLSSSRGFHSPQPECRSEPSSASVPASDASSTAHGRASLSAFSAFSSPSSLILRFTPNFKRQLSIKARRNCSNIGVTASAMNSPAFVPDSVVAPSPAPAGGSSTAHGCGGSLAAFSAFSSPSSLILRFPPNFKRQLSIKARCNCSNIGVTASATNSPAFVPDSVVAPSPAPAGGSPPFAATADELPCSTVVNGSSQIIAADKPISASSTLAVHGGLDLRIMNLGEGRFQEFYKSLDLREWEDDGTGKVFFNGKQYNRRDPNFIKERNAYFVEKSNLLTNKLKPGSSLLEELGQIRGNPIVFQRDNDFYRPMDFTCNLELQEILATFGN